MFHIITIAYLRPKTSYLPHPAHGVGVAEMGRRELCRDPAVDRVTDILLDADEDGEDNENARRVLSIESIDEIIVGADFEVLQLEDGFNEFVHLLFSSCSLAFVNPILQIDATTASLSSR